MNLFKFYLYWGLFLEFYVVSSEELSLCRTVGNSGLRKVSLKNVICTADDEYFSIAACKLFVGNRTHKRLAITVNLLKDIDFIWLRFKHWSKSSKNIYQPGLFDVIIDVCDVAKNLLNENFNFGKHFLDTAAPNWRSNFGHLLHLCPYSNQLVFNQSITGLPCNTIYEYGHSIYGRLYSAKTELMFYRRKFVDGMQPNMIITLFDAFS